MIGPFILMYHSIADDSDDPYSVPVDAFRDQMSWLANKGYEVVPLSQLFDSLQAGKLRRLNKCVVITFDDGYRDFIDNALSVLLDYSATATVFLVTDMLGKKASWIKSGEQAKLMTEDDARDIKASGMSLGSHTATHADLNLLEQDKLQKQLVNSIGVLKDLGESFCPLAYPWGRRSPQVEQAVEAAGYECAVAVGEQMRLAVANRYRLPRVAMRKDLALKRFGSHFSRTNIEMDLRRIYSTVKGKLRVLQKP